MSTVNNGRTNASEMRDMVRKLGGTPKGRTSARLLDEIEQLAGSGGSADSDELDASDFDDIFGVSHDTEPSSD
ncbi:MAG: hypothetical protein IKF14_18315 [Atopobiaceae bacterium]|nr:hypothetical protein [Atopobiaceae bacterium]MBR3161044.1 hypothetical protein [Atopobiaceae bacterium]